MLCHGSALCKTDLCGILSSNKYEGFCFGCFMNEYPDSIIVRNYRNKEFAVTSFILDNFNNMSWISNKLIKKTGSRKRPDLLLELENKIIIIEIDENQHSRYTDETESERMKGLSQDVNNKPIIFIRFNPDNYIDIDGEKIKSCWGVIELRGIIQVINKNEWCNRLDILKNVVDYWIKTKPSKNIDIEYLFYDAC